MTRARLERALSPNYWRGIRPAETPSSTSTALPTAGVEERLVRQLEEQGYSQLDSFFDPTRVSSLARVAESVRAEGWPAVFSFVFDDFWLLAWQPPLRRVAEIALGGPVLFIPHLAVHLTTWIPLTDATLRNGCMYVVPNSDDESVRRAVERYSNRKMSFADVQLLLQHARALPAAAGSVLCWGFDLLHWGSVNRDSPVPRVSVAFSLSSGSPRRNHPGRRRAAPRSR